MAFESGVAALWEAIVRARRTGDFPARQSRMCEWCSYQAFCPEFGGTAPPYPGAPEYQPDPAPPEYEPPEGGVAADSDKCGSRSPRRTETARLLRSAKVADCR